MFQSYIVHRLYYMYICIWRRCYVNSIASTKPNIPPFRPTCKCGSCINNTVMCLLVRQPRRTSGPCARLWRGEPSFWMNRGRCVMCACVTSNIAVNMYNVITTFNGIKWNFSLLPTMHVYVHEYVPLLRVYLRAGELTVCVIVCLRIRFK